MPSAAVAATARCPVRTRLRFLSGRGTWHRGWARLGIRPRPTAGPPRSRPVDAAAAEEMAKLFLEVIAAPKFEEGAKQVFASKKNLRLVEVPAGQQKWVLKNISGGMLVQDADLQKAVKLSRQAIGRGTANGWMITRAYVTNGQAD